MWVSNHVPVTVDARTWYVKQDGTGDAPTIYAAVDSSVTGDTVLVGPGEYEIWTAIWMKNGIVVTSEQGPHKTRLIPGPDNTPAYAFVCQNIWIHTEISGFWIEGFRWSPSDQGAISIVNASDLYIKNNVLLSNGAAAIAIDVTFDSLVHIVNNTIVNSTTYGLVGGGSYGNVRNNIIRGRMIQMARFPLIHCNCLLDVTDAGLQESINFQDDPQFCGSLDSGNVYLQSDSPCAPGNTPIPIPDCGLVGALPVGCGETPVRSATWGELKRLYR
jgi:hypothetical protein